jgi:hypothetical protein
VSGKWLPSEADPATVQRRIRTPTVSRTYDISIVGRLEALAAAFFPHEVAFQDGVSLVRAREIDQSALHRLIQRTQSLGLELLEVRIVPA